MLNRAYPTQERRELTSKLYKEYIDKYFLNEDKERHVFNYSALPFELEKNVLFTSKEKEVIYLYYNRFAITEIADILDVSVRTINRYMRKIRLKLKCQSNNHIISSLFDRYRRIYTQSTLPRCRGTSHVTQSVLLSKTGINGSASAIMHPK